MGSPVTNEAVDALEPYPTLSLAVVRSVGLALEDRQEQRLVRRIRDRIAGDRDGRLDGARSVRSALTTWAVAAAKAG